MTLASARHDGEEDQTMNQTKTPGAAPCPVWLATVAAMAFVTVAAVPNRAQAVPAPIHEWLFSTGSANDIIGNMNGTLHGDAYISNGELVLDGSGNNGGAYMSTAFDTVSLTAMTLVSWVSLGTLSQGGGSALSVVNSSQNFDAIDFGERVTDQWMAGSDGFSRSLSNNGGAAITTLSQEMVAITYDASGNIEIYVNGALYANGGSFSPYTLVNPEYEIGQRHPSGANALLTGDVAMSEVFSSTLSATDIATLYSEGTGGTPIPEPGSAALVMAGVGLVSLVRRKRA
jgi:hypothetical protein